MSRELRLRPAAESDLAEIWDYTEQEHSRAQAIDYLQGLDATLRLLADYPEIARLRDDFTPPVRLHRYRAHIVVYVADKTTLEVIRVLHGRANWDVVLSE